MNLDNCPFCGFPVEQKEIAGEGVSLICNDPKSSCHGSGLVIAIFPRDNSYEKGEKAWNQRATACTLALIGRG